MKRTDRLVIPAQSTALRTRTTAGLALMLCGCSASPGAAETLASCSSPFVTPEAPSLPGAICAPVPTPPPRFVSPNPYRSGDGTFSEADPARTRQQRQALAPLRQFTSGVTRYANRYVESRGTDRVAGTCALRWLKTWAEADALRDAPDHMAQYSRSVGLAAWAIAYAQIAGVQTGEADDKRDILTWMMNLADDTTAHYDRLASAPARNNHRYWAGLSAYAVGAVAQAPRLCAWGVGSARIGLDQVDAQGALPLELARRSKARDYHLYAAGPLVLLAQYAAHDGIDLYGYNRGALHRLVDFTIRSIADPAAIVRLSGASQEPLGDVDGSSRRQQTAFVEFYEARFPGRVAAVGPLLSHRPLINAELGGDLTMLAQIGLLEPSPTRTQEHLTP